MNERNGLVRNMDDECVERGKRLIRMLYKCVKLSKKNLMNKNKITALEKLSKNFSMIYYNILRKSHYYYIMTKTCYRGT